MTFPVGAYEGSVLRVELLNLNNGVLCMRVKSVGKVLQEEEFRSTARGFADNSGGSGDVAKVIGRRRKLVHPKIFHLDYQKISYVLTQFFHCPPSSWDPQRLERKYIFNVMVSEPEEYFLDYKSNEILTMLQVEKRELEHSLNWLSTLGGAFSALGENCISFAQRAGNVSKGQLLIAVKLGSPQIMSRCRLYAAISLIQLDQLKSARTILLREYAYAKSPAAESDPRLRKMCIGIWAKLKYEWMMKNKKKSRRIDKIN